MNNIFKKSRKAKESDDAFNFDAPPVKASRGLTRRKKKNEEVEEKPIFNLDTALPESDNFRTSLIMPSLSTRFSMLREQDDPNTKVGKASDDSVLFPKRASRLNLFGQHTLTDIAEVESIHSTFKPPFAEQARHGSISDGYGSDEGSSVMNRARPGESNNLFGGRQKLYQISTSSQRDLAGNGLTGGKHTYASDVSLSAFQQLRLREKQMREQEEKDLEYAIQQDSDEIFSSQSPATGFSRNRGTQSSTNSGPSNNRTSTAATSVTSEAPVTRQSSNAAVMKVREQDANSSAESIGFSASPSFRKLREDGPRHAHRLSQSRSAADLRSNSTRASPAMNSPGLRARSPPPSAPSHVQDFFTRDGLRSAGLPSRFQTASPTSPLESEHGDSTLAGSVGPNDRGKATALGLFNKPKQQYDEQQYLQRQLQMHEGRASPFSQDSRSASRASPELARRDRQNSSSSNLNVEQSLSEATYTPQVPPIPDTPLSPVSPRRSSQGSTSGKSFSRPRTKSSASTREAAVKARVESLIRRQNAELAAMETAQLGPFMNPNTENEENMPPLQKQAGTFFDNSDGSDDEVQEPRRPSMKSTNSKTLAPTDVHPAFRDEATDVNSDSRSLSGSAYARQSSYSSGSRPYVPSSQARASVHDSVMSAEDLDSPTLGQNTGLGLSGLIRTHLRQDSDKSSMFPPPSPGISFIQPDAARTGSIASDSRTMTESTRSDPFEYESHRPQPAVTVAELPPTPTTLMSQKAQQILGIANALRQAQEEAAQNTLANSESVPTPRPEQDFDTRAHQRTESTETQKEQQRFDEELAERRRRIQDQLKSVQERSRSRSPVGDRGHGFLLPRFPGRNVGDSGVQNKAMKMLGMSNATRDGTSPRPTEPWMPEQEQQRNGGSRQGHRHPTAPDAEFRGGRRTPNSPHQPARAYTANDGFERPPPPRSTTPSSRRPRDRSNSAVADHSMSRNRQQHPAMPGQYHASPDPMSPPARDPARRNGSPNDKRREDYTRQDSGNGHKEQQGYFSHVPLAPPEHHNGFTPRPSPRPSPGPMDGLYPSPMVMPMSPPSSALPSPNPVMTNGRGTPTSLPGRSTPIGSRKRSVTKGMISDPTFVSSTSSVPLVHLPQHGGPAVEPVFVPPVPAMNPRRRVDTPENQTFAPHPAVRPSGSEFQNSPDYTNLVPRGPLNLAKPMSPPQHRQRNKLRKSSSEGGNMAARARQEALMAEMARERERSPNVAVFPNRSATMLHQEGSMF